MNNLQNIIFDFDGTLADTAPLIIITMQAAMREMGLPLKSEEECRATIGLRLEDIPAVLWPGMPDGGRRYATTYRRIFDENKSRLMAGCFPGVAATVTSLHEAGFRMAVASSRSHRSLEEYVDRFGLADCFCRLVGGDDVEHGKPAPDPVLSILSSGGMRAEETLVVGDAAVDILMGRAAGCRTCGVTYGNGTRRELEEAGAHHIIDSFCELARVIPAPV